MDRREGKRLLRRCREARGWSWADEAIAIRATARRLWQKRLAETGTASIRRDVARWENPAGTVPDERHQQLLTQLLVGRTWGDEGSPRSGQPGSAVVNAPPR
jgi:hypothetical protein